MPPFVCVGGWSFCVSLSVTVLELPAVSVCVGVCIAGLCRRVMLSLVSELSVLCSYVHHVVVCPTASASLAIHHNPSVWLGSTGAAWSDPQWSNGVLYLWLLSPMLLPSSRAGPKEAWGGGLLAS